MNVSVALWKYLPMAEKMVRNLVKRQSVKEDETGKNICHQIETGLEYHAVKFSRINRHI
jgi:hypothetical protein